MSGHSKWSQIKRQKGVADSKRSAVFTKLAGAITVAVREGGKDPTMNFRLRLAIEKARSANMPNDNIERAIKRGAGELGERPLETVTYEGYGPDGVAIVIETLTDNRNRTAGDIRRVLGEAGGSLAGSNSVLWMFERQGFIEVNPGSNREAVGLAAIEAGAADIEDVETHCNIYTPPASLSAVQDAVKKTGAEILNSEIALIAKTTTAPRPAHRDQITDLLLTLEDLQDVTSVATNADL